MTEKFSFFIRENTNKIYYLLQRWKFASADESTYNNSPLLTVVLTDATNYWTGTFTKSELEQLVDARNFTLEAIRVKLSEEAFDENMPNGLADGYVVKLEQSDDFVATNLTLKKRVADQVFTLIVTLKLTIEDDPTPRAEQLFKHCIGSIGKLKARVGRMENEIREIKLDRDETLQMFRECVNEKNKVEMELFGKFNQLLNAKKRKLRELANGENGKNDDDNNV